jgi:hypothetical protein
MVPLLTTTFRVRFLFEGCDEVLPGPQHWLRSDATSGGDELSQWWLTVNYGRDQVCAMILATASLVASGTHRGPRSRVSYQKGTVTGSEVHVNVKER